MKTHEEPAPLTDDETILMLDLMARFGFCQSKEVPPLGLSFLTLGAATKAIITESQEGCEMNDFVRSAFSILEAFESVSESSRFKLEIEIHQKIQEMNS